MGTINEKISYLAETKTRQKNLINALGGEITNETPFREYEQELIGVLPKVTGEGTNFSLSPTIEYDLDVGYKGDTSQETTTGKNLLDYVNLVHYGSYNGMTSTLNEDGSVTTTGVPSYSYAEIMSIRLENYVTLENGAKYTISMGSANPYLYMQINATNTQTSQVEYYSLASGTSISFTANSNCTYLFRIQATTTSNWGGSRTITNTYQLEKSASATSFEKYCGGIPSPNPNYPQDILAVTGTQELKVVGKNLFNYSTDFYGSVSLSNYITNNNDGTFTTTGLGGLITAITKTLSAGTYTISLQACEGYSLGSMYIRNTGGSNGTPTYTFTLSETTTMTFSIRAYDNVTKFYIQLEVGSTATIYSPYTSQTYTLHLGDEELCKIGNKEDRYYYNNGVWYKDSVINKVVLNGSETSWAYASGNKVFWSSLNALGFDYPSSYKGYVPKISNYFTYYASSGNNPNLVDGMYENTQTSSNSQVLIHFASITNVDDFKTWLSTHNTEVRYVSYEPSTTEITDTTLLQDLNYIKENAMSYSGTTNISSSGDLPIVISASAIKQLS